MNRQVFIIFCMFQHILVYLLIIAQHGQSSQKGLPDIQGHHHLCLSRTDAVGAAFAADAAVPVSHKYRLPVRLGLFNGAVGLVFIGIDNACARNSHGILIVHIVLQAGKSRIKFNLLLHNGCASA